MCFQVPSGARLIGPAPEVLKAIRSEIKKRRLTPRDRRMSSVAAALAVPPAQVRGLNEGIFYYEGDLPARAAAARSPSRAVRSRPTTGTLRCLVLLVDFSDNPGNRPPQEFRDMLFSKGTYATGSMRDFYLENSYRRCDVQGEIVGWLRLPRPYSYYVGTENGMGPYPNNAQRMVEDALALAAQQIDFSTMDADADGYLDGLFVVHAGGGAEADPRPAARAAKIWSHQWNLPRPFVSNGVTAFSYFTAPEDGRVGVFSHEFGHMLGLPDLYDTTYESEGVGAWCVMGAGSWNDGGLTPGHFCLWAKARLGWIKPTNVKRARTLKLKPIEQYKRGSGYRLWTKGRSGSEYFLIENRQLVGFDRKLPQPGLVLWHVDDSEHNNDHPGDYWVAVKQADGRLDLEQGRNRGDRGDPFPGTSGNTKVDATTTPNTRDQFGNPTGVSISNIADGNGVISCRVRV